MASECANHARVARARAGVSPHTMHTTHKKGALMPTHTIHVDPAHAILVYEDEAGNQFEQPATDVVEVGTLIDDNGDDMPIIDVKVMM